MAGAFGVAAGVAGAGLAAMKNLFNPGQIAADAVGSVVKKLFEDNPATYKGPKGDSGDDGEDGDLQGLVALHTTEMTGKMARTGPLETRAALGIPPSRGGSPRTSQTTG